jgi:hypothetical protein
MLFDLTFPCYLTTFSGKKCLSGKVICAFFCPAYRSSPVHVIYTCTFPRMWHIKRFNPRRLKVVRGGETCLEPVQVGQLLLAVQLQSNRSAAYPARGAVKQRSLPLVQLLVQLEILNTPALARQNQPCTVYPPISGPLTRGGSFQVTSLVGDGL